ncbi:MAG: caspase family protein [Bacteroidales bacterium]|nr:caspase family protein [Bacteroidales bacterium]
MRTRSVLFFLLLLAVISHGQVISGKSGKKKITFTTTERSVVTQLPDLIITGEKFIDENQNNFINANEDCQIRMNIENIGEGVAEQVKVKVALKNNDIQGLSFKKMVDLGNLQPNSSTEVTIPIKGEVNLQEGLAEFQIEVQENRGFDAFPLEIKIETKEFAKPNVIVADAEFSTEDGGLIKLNYPINLKVIVQNIGEGDAKDVVTDFKLPNANCVFLGEQNRHNLGNLGRGETKELEFLFTATRRYTLNEIPVMVDISESLNKYARDTTLFVGLEQRLTAKNEVVISGIATTSPDIHIASLSSEVDKNIPVNRTKHPYRYALIIGNEDYAKFQRGLETETNVEFARKDAEVFMDYAVKTLGVDEINAHLLKDATTGEIYQKIDLLSKLASKTGEQAEIIFYYAGHGLPDEITRAPYLIPVDVSGTNLSAAIKLEDIYKKFAESEAGRVTIFLDACFSGGGRDAGLLAARSVKVKPKENMIFGNLAVFSASSGEQSALPYENEQHGMFTYYLLKKLQETKGDVTYGDLADYIMQNVSIESLRVNQKEQDPVVNVSPDVDQVWRSWNFQ